MACFPILRAIGYGFLGFALSLCILLPLMQAGVISDDTVVSTSVIAYVVFGMGRLLLGIFIDKD